MAALKDALPGLPHDAAPALKDLRGAKDFLRGVGDRLGDGLSGLEGLVGRAAKRRRRPGRRRDTRRASIAGAAGSRTYKLYVPVRLSTASRCRSS